MKTLFAALLTAALAGCGINEGESLDQDNGAAVSADALAALPMGLFGPVTRDALNLTSLELKSGNLYQAEVKVSCVTEPCAPVIETGTYRTSTAGSLRYLTLKPANSQSRSYIYTVYDNASITLRTYGTTRMYTFNRLPTTCGGVGVTAARGGCPTAYHCTCPNGMYCYVEGECVHD